MLKNTQEGLANSDWGSWEAALNSFLGGKKRMEQVENIRDFWIEKKSHKPRKRGMDMHAVFIKW